MRVHVVHPVPEAISMLSGDVVRGLRGALDQLATGLAGAGAPVKFPVFESLVLFAQRARKALARMPDEAQAHIEALQPYHAIGGARNDPLWTLKNLDETGPPRLAAGAVREGGSIGVNTQRDLSIVGDPNVPATAFADGAVISSVGTRVAGPDPKLDMFLRAEFALAFAPGSPGHGQELVELLGALCDHVEHEVFGVLEPWLT